jgi:hypothetical protein
MSQSKKSYKFKEFEAICHRTLTRHHTFCGQDILDIPETNSYRRRSRTPYLIKHREAAVVSIFHQYEIDCQFPNLRRSSMSNKEVVVPSSNLDAFYTKPHNLVDLFEGSAAKFASENLFGTKNKKTEQYEWVT